MSSPEFRPPVHDSPEVTRGIQRIIAQRPNFFTERGINQDSVANPESLNKLYSQEAELKDAQWALSVQLNQLGYLLTSLPDQTSDIDQAVATINDILKGNYRSTGWTIKPHGGAAEQIKG